MSELGIFKTADEPPCGARAACRRRFGGARWLFTTQFDFMGARMNIQISVAATRRQPAGRSDPATTVNFFAAAAAAILSFSLAMAANATAAASVRPCGTADGVVREPLARDALAALQAAVGQPARCARCLCDVDGNGRVTAADALRVLRRAVDSEFSLACAPCPCIASRRIETGRSPRSVEAADLNNDGRIDLVTADTDSATVSLLFGVTRGRFAAQTPLPTPTTPQTVSVADLNADGAPDLVTANALPNSVALFFNDGIGGFSAAVELAAGEAPIVTAAGDLDGDTIVDLVVANSLSDDVSVFLGTGGGAFATQERFTVGAGPRWVALAHLNDDEALDAVTADRDDDTLSLLFGKGDGTFEAATAIETRPTPYAVRTEDMNGDGDTDLVVASLDGQGAAVLLGDGNGGFTESAFAAIGSPIIAVEVADLDGDGKLDVVAGHWTGGSPGLSVAGGDGTGGLDDPAFIANLGRTRALCAGDVNDDGLVDLVAANFANDDISLFAGRGDLVFSPERISQATMVTRDAEVLDVDGDGHLDLVTANAYGAVTILFGDGGGRFVRDGIDAEPHVDRVFPVHVDDDGVLDFVLAKRQCVAAAGTHGGGPPPLPECGDFSAVSIVAGTGGGSFADEIDASSIPDLHDAIAVDFNDDGLADLAAVIDDRPQGLALLSGHGDGSFGAPVEHALGAATRLFEAADLDGDGRIEVVGSTGDELFVATVDVTLDLPRLDRAPLASTDGPVAVADIDGDGRRDVVQIDKDLREIVVHLTSNDGRLGEGLRSAAALADGFKELGFGDLDQDGALDLVAATVLGLVLGRGDGNGGFGESVEMRERVPTLFHFDGISAVGVADFDEDGVPDIAATAEGATRADVVLNEQPGNCLIP